MDQSDMRHKNYIQEDTEKTYLYENSHNNLLTNLLFYQFHSKVYMDIHI